jgi:hypothetical protein
MGRFLGLALAATALFCLSARADGYPSYGYYPSAGGGAARGEVLIYEGLNFSSPRSVSSPIANSGLTLGFGYRLRGPLFFAEADISYIARRIGDFDEDVRTMFFPLLFGLRVGILEFSAGPYLAWVMNTDVPGRTLRSTDYGPVVGGGIRLPLSPRVSILLEGRVSLSLVTSIVEPELIWRQAQAIAALHVAVGSN